MAVIIGTKNPLDVFPGKGIGVSLNFTEDGVFNVNYTTQNQLNSNLVNFFLTNRGERVANPNFGANLRQFVFEQVSTNNIEAIRDKIKYDIRQNFPNVKVNEIVILGDEDVNSIQIQLYYTYIPSNTQDSVILNV